MSKTKIKNLDVISCVGSRIVQLYDKEECHQPSLPTLQYSSFDRFVSNCPVVKQNWANTHSLLNLFTIKCGTQCLNVSFNVCCRSIEQPRFCPQQVCSFGVSQQAFDCSCCLVDLVASLGQQNRAGLLAACLLCPDV